MKKNNIKTVGLSVVLILLVVAFGPICVGEEKPDNDNIANLGTLQYEPKSHDFGAKLEGETDSTTFEIWRGGGCCALTYVLIWDCSWVAVFPTSGSSNGEHDVITVSIDTTGLELGPHTCDITIDSDSGDKIFPVSVNIVDSAEPVLAYDPESHDFGAKLEGETDSTTFEIWNNGLGELIYTLFEECSWVDIYPTSGSSNGEHDTITVDIDTTGLEFGLHTCDITIDSNGGTGAFTFTVDIYGGIEIEINGGFGVKATIRNNGYEDATGVEFNISVTGGILGAIDEVEESIIPTLPVGDEMLVEIPVFGLGRIEITAVAEDANKTSSGFVFLFFVYLR